MSYAKDQLPSLPEHAAEWDPIVAFYDMQLMDNTGLGLLEQYGANNHVNHLAYMFMESQYKRFRVSIPDEDMLSWCWDFAFYALDQVDPYLLFHGTTDVYKTDIPFYNQISVLDAEKDQWRDVNGDESEHFRLRDPKDTAKAFDIMMRNPGLAKYFDAIHDYFGDRFAFMHETPESLDFYEHKLYQKYGEKTQDIAHLGIWAALMWMIAPLPESRDWRYDFHPIFQLCYDHGECLLSGWNFFPPEFFRVFDRPVRSCHFCGVNEFCIELAQHPGDKNVYYTCQHCLSGGEPFPGMVCGTKDCSHVKCPNHPLHDKIDDITGNRKVRQLEAKNRYGELQNLGGGHKSRELPGMMYVSVNYQAINKSTKSIADDVGKVFSKQLKGLLDK